MFWRKKDTAAGLLDGAKWLRKRAAEVRITADALDRRAAEAEAQAAHIRRKETIQGLLPFGG